MTAVEIPVVAVRMSLYQWVRLLGYLEGVGCGDELEHHHWIQSQLNPYLKGDPDDE